MRGKKDDDTEQNPSSKVSIDESASELDVEMMMKGDPVDKNRTPSSQWRKWGIVGSILAIIALAVGLRMGTRGSNTKTLSTSSLSRKLYGKKNKTVQHYINYSCEQDSDCVIMDVGSCCGYYPVCLHKNSTPDPSKACEGGGSSICGFPSIENCVCDTEQFGGRCQADNSWP
jgi:hypothetical protein